MQELTLAYLLTPERICLGYKKRGFGQGNWNGYGGKIKAGESIKAAAVREITEESVVTVRESDLEQVGDIEFYFTDGTHLRVHTFFTRAWTGEPQETEEMRPQWFLYADIPYEQMWKDDIHWMPRALAGEKITGKVWFDSSGAEIAKMEWKSVEQF